ncbi:MAG: 30S ribosomal protein S20 [Chlorobiota bacterium]|jgi:small subunit ribosomal protein S20
MANHQSAVKRNRQSKKRNLYNREYKKQVKVAVRAVRESTDYESGMKNLSDAVKVLDRASAKGIIHKNNASRRKSRLSKYIKSLKKD